MSALDQYVTAGDEEGLLNMLENDTSITQKDKDYSLATAACYCFPNIVKVLIEHGADVNDPYTLMFAVYGGHKCVIDALIDMGVDITASVNSNMFLSTVVMNGNIDMVKYLLSKGVKVGIENALVIARRDGRLDIVEVLESA